MKKKKHNPRNVIILDMILRCKGGAHKKKKYKRTKKQEVIKEYD